MQVIQTVNDTIRILFNPLEEGFKLLDFLLVQDEQNKFLAQIIEIYDDKYDASQNVARVKLFFKVNDDGEVLDYDHYTPSKECEIKKIRQDEIIKFINEDKESLTIGLNYKNEKPFDLNMNFFKNSPAIFADKIEQSNCLSSHLAQVLSRYNKHSVIFDYSGTLEIKGAKKLILTKDIKMPLDFCSIEYIWEKGLATASLETQSICREIFNEVQSFAKNTPEGYIPFDKFLKVVNIQYKATPIVELTVLLNKLKAYQKNSIFARNKKDFECINKSVNKNDITIIDFSRLKTEWHKEFSEFIIREIKNEAFVFLRLNDENSDVDLINYMYDKKPDVSFIPSISYSFKKMPHIVERINNYMLLPTFNPRRDFGAANYELASISDDECIIFGKDTENFIFVIKNNKFEINQQEEKFVRKTIRLKIEDVNNTPVEMDFDGAKFTPKTTEVPKEQAAPAVVESQITEAELEFFEQFTRQEENAEEQLLAKKSESSDTIEYHKEEPPVEENEIEQDSYIEEMEQKPQEDDAEPYADEEIIEVEAQDVTEETQDEEEPYEEPQTRVVYEQIESEEQIESKPVEEEIADTENNPEEVVSVEAAVEEEIIEQEPDEILPEPKQPQEDEQFAEQEDNEPVQQEITGFQNILEEEEQEAQETKEDDSFSLESIAAQSIEATFNEVVGDTNAAPKNDNVSDGDSTLVIDENVVIDLEKIHNEDENTSELPIFRHKKEKNTEKYEFQTGDTVEHDKYGKGEVVKVINYANRSLLQINFEEVGKRLLDPDIAKIKPI